MPCATIERPRHSTDRLTIIAPHPDDEVFGMGGLMRELVLLGYRLRVVAVTDGEAAFGAMTTAEQAALATVRADERAAALDVLEVVAQTEVIRLQLADAAVGDHEAELGRMIAELAGPSLFATWRGDGHPDHEATGRAAATAAAIRSIPLYEYTVWAAHRGRSTGGRAVQRVTLRPDTLAAKWRAVHEFRSQLEPSPDGRPVVPADLVERLRTDDEVLLPTERVG